MPDIHFKCPKCGQTLDSPEELSAQLIDCPTCKETIEVPVRSQPTEPPKIPHPAPASPQTVLIQQSAAAPQKHLHGITSGQGTVIIVMLIFGIFVLPFLQSQISKVLQPQQWEYRIVSIPDYSFSTEINTLGFDGWELVLARRASDGSKHDPTMSYEMIFKRPKRLLK